MCWRGVLCVILFRFIPLVLVSVQLITNVNIVEGVYTHKLRKVTTSPNFCKAARTCLLSVNEQGIGSVVMCTALAASRERGEDIFGHSVSLVWIVISCLYLESRGTGDGNRLRTFCAGLGIRTKRLFYGVIRHKD